MSTISLTTFALFSLLVIPSFPFYKSIHPLNLIPLNGPFVELLFNKIIFSFPIPHCNNIISIFIGFFIIFFMYQNAIFFYNYVYFYFVLLLLTNYGVLIFSENY